MPKGKQSLVLVEVKKIWLCDAEQLPDVLKKRRMILWVVECRDMDLWAER
jgi:hypothetical protein